jgi:uncharacterized membrane protein (UPF0127 family)
VPRSGPPASSGADRSDPYPDRGLVRALRLVITLLLVLGIAGFLVDGANRPADPGLVPPPDPAAQEGSPAMGSATLSVVPARAAPACVLEAASEAQQRHGLMGRRSLAPYTGMAFVFARPTTERFWMKATLIPLSIAWFGSTGRFEASAAMAPCPASASTCPTYGPARPYQLAVEVPAGGLQRLGIGPGTTVQLGGPCT